jgi:Tfp pilus assembly protein PilZ
MDRRKAIRFFLELKVELSLINQPDAGTIKALTRDISHSGVFVKTRAPFKLGQEVNIFLYLDEKVLNAENLKGQGRVVRVEPEGVAICFDGCLAAVNNQIPDQAVMGGGEDSPNSPILHASESDSLDKGGIDANRQAGG